MCLELKYFLILNWLSFGILLVLHEKESSITKLFEKCWDKLVSALGLPRTFHYLRSNANSQKENIGGGVSQIHLVLESFLETVIKPLCFMWPWIRIKIAQITYASLHPCVLVSEWRDNDSFSTGRLWEFRVDALGAVSAIRNCLITSNCWITHDCLISHIYIWHTHRQIQSL